MSVDLTLFVHKRLYGICLKHYKVIIFTGNQDTNLNPEIVRNITTGTTSENNTLLAIVMSVAEDIYRRGPITSETGALQLPETFTVCPRK